MTCAEIRDRIPDFVADMMTAESAETLRVHLDGCEPCAAELELVRDLSLSRPDVPAGLEARVIDAVRTAAADDSESAAAILPIRRRPAPRFHIPTWAMGAAAILVLAIGTPLVVDRMQDEGRMAASDDFMEDTPIVSLWASDDGLMAGAPMLDGLTDEELLALLDGMEEDV